jgi:hypothetical protein
MWIEVTASYGDTVVWSSGAWDQAAGTIEDDDQVRRYEAIAENFADGTRNHLLQNNHWVVDNRIPPRGLTPNVQTDPVGDRYTAQNDGTWPHFDTTSYTFAANDTVVDATPGDPNDDELTVRIRLRYLINTPDYVQQLVDDNMTNAAGTDVAGMFEELGGAYPVDLAEEVVLTIPITGFGEGPGTGSTTDASTSSGGSDSASASSSGTTAGETSGVETGTDTAGSDGGGDEGCGCTVRPRGLPGWLWLPLLVGLRRRRQPKRSLDT